MLASLATTVLIAAACGDIVEPEPFTMATSTTAAEVESGASSVEPPDPTVAGAALSTDFLPNPPDNYESEVLISTRQGLLSATPGGLVQTLTAPFAGLRTTRAVDDLLGGLVYENVSTGGVVWLSAQGEAQDLLDGAPARLLDVGYLDGSPSAVLLTDSGLVEQIRLADRLQTPLLELGEDEEILALSTSGALHALAVADDQCGAVRFFGADGAEVDLNGPRRPSCPVPRRPAFGALALSPEGGALVYTRVSYRDDGLEVSTELVARELGTGTEYYQTVIGQEGDRITSVAFDGERVVYLLKAADGTALVAVLDLGQAGQSRAINLEGIVTTVDSVSFVRLPLAHEQ